MQPKLSKFITFINIRYVYSYILVMCCLTKLAYFCVNRRGQTKRKEWYNERAIRVRVRVS